MSEKDSMDEAFEKSFKSVGKGLSKIFKDKIKASVLSIFIFGFILRLIAARNLGVFPDDANHAINPIGIFGSDKLVNWGQSTGLWYYIQGVFYKLFGPTTMASRFASVLFGSFLIIIMFLFVKRFFKSDKAALAASFLIAVSPMLIKHTLPEMDVTVCFFLILSSYFFLGYFESKAKKELILSAVFIGIATMIKFYALFFAFSFFIYLVFRQLQTDKNLKKLLSKAFLFALIILVMITPTLAHNFLLYSDKGFMDLEFTNILGLGVAKAEQYYSWGAGWKYNQEEWTDWGGFFFGNQRHFDSVIPGFILVVKPLFYGSPLLFLLGLLGLFFVFKKHRTYFWFFLITLLPAYAFLGANIPMTKHLIWILPLLAPSAGVFIEQAIEKIKLIKLEYVLAFVLIFSLIFLGIGRPLSNSPFYGQSSFNKMVDYKNDEIPDSALVVVDSRIYRGFIHWGFAGTNYIEAGQFFEIAEELNKQGNTVALPVYYFECVADDCGWGYIASQPEFNESMERTTAWFANASFDKKDFQGAAINGYYLPFSDNSVVRYRTYKLNLNLNPMILNTVKQTHIWFLYPVGYDRTISPIFDDYETKGPGTVFNGFAWFVHYFELIFAFFAIFYVAYLFLKEE